MVAKRKVSKIHDRSLSAASAIARIRELWTEDNMALKALKDSRRRRTMRCEECGNVMESRKTTPDQAYLYDLCGLDNIFLVGITVHECAGCDAVIPEIPRVPELNQVIAEELAKKQTFLTGREIRFLRNRASLSAKEFAVLLDVDPAHLSRVENGHTQSLGGAADKLARVAVAEGGQVQELLKRFAQSRLEEAAQPSDIRFKPKKKWERIEEAA